MQVCVTCIKDIAVPPKVSAAKTDLPPSPGVAEFSRRPGLKPGQKHSGSFQKGDDPRRHVAGPYKAQVQRDFKEKINEMVDDALGVLSDVMGSDKAPLKERRAAAELVIAHAVGSPVNRVMHAQVGGSGQQASTLSLADLRQRASALLDDPKPEIAYDASYEVVSDD